MIPLASSVCLTFVAWLLALSPATAQQDDTLQLAFPGSNVSSRPILEFRYRETKLIPPTLTHAFVVLGRELDNGTTVFFGAAGLYPTGNEKVLRALKNVFDSPGQVTYTMSDLRSTDVFRVKITGEQENAVRFLVNSWNAGEYSLFEQNCTSLIKSVANMLGLDTGNPTNASEFTPAQLIRHLKMENDPEKPLRQSLKQWQEAAKKIQSQRASMNALKEHIMKHAEEVARAQAEWTGWSALHSQWSAQYYQQLAPTVTIQPQVNLFPADNPLSAYWPWPPPSPLKNDVVRPPMAAPTVVQP